MKSYRRYNGEKDYIFASFSEKDEEIIEQLIEKLAAIGYRIKLEDKSAAMATTVNELVSSKVMLLALTENYIADPQSYRLLQKAEAMHKPMVIFVPAVTSIVKEVIIRLISSPESTLLFRPGEEITDSKTATMLLKSTLGLTPDLASNLFVQAKERYENSKDPEALKYIRLTASEGCVKAVLWLGKYNLERARKNIGLYAPAIDYLYKAAKNGDTEAIYILGKMLLDGEAFERTPRLAYTYILKSARHGFPKAQLELANMYDRGIGTEIDKKLAFKWYTIAADNGVTESYLPLGLKYLEGANSIEENPQQALKYLTLSASSGIADAHLILAHLYKDGTDKIDQDHEKSTEHFKSAAEAGICEAQYFYSYCLKKGIGCKKNKSTAFHWMKLAACDRSDSAEGSPDAIYQLGIYYHKGIGCKKNLKNAFICYYNAAKFGHAAALRAVSECYKRGIGTTQNPHAAKVFKAKYQEAHRA